VRKNLTVSLYTPFVLAVGHAGDEPFAQRVSDRSFPTPGDLGSYLKEMYVNSGREDDFTEQENELRIFRKQLNAERIELRVKDDELSKKADYLENETNTFIEKDKELILVKEENTKLKQQNDLNTIKNKRHKYQVAAALLFSLLLAAATYFSTAYFFNDSKTPNIYTNVNSNMKTTSNFSNSKNK